MAMTKFHLMDSMSAASANGEQIFKKDQAPQGLLGLVVAFDVLVFASTHLNAKLWAMGHYALLHFLLSR